MEYKGKDRRRRKHNEENTGRVQEKQTRSEKKLEEEQKTKLKTREE
jgi:hypothetical protein